MSEGLQDQARVEQRMASIEAVGKVMRAVWALARAQQPQVEAAAADASAYLDAIEAIVERIAGPPQALEADAEVLWVLIGPERPFCGPLARLLLDQLPPEGSVGLVGSRLCEVASQSPALDERVVFRLAGATTPEDLGRRAEALARAILEAKSPSVVVLTPEQGGSNLQSTTLLAGARGLVEHPPETFLPVEQVLEAAVLESVAGRLAVALAEALRAEVRARLIASEAARLACDRQVDDLRHQWRTLRQSAITQELLELIAGR